MSRQKIYFYVAGYGTDQRFAVPVHLVAGDPYSDPWPTIRGLAGRWKGRTFRVTKHDLYSSIPPDAKLVPGGRAAIKENAPWEPKEAQAARVLRKKIATLNIDDAWTAKRADATFAQVERIAESLYPYNPDNTAWEYYKRDRERWLDAFRPISGYGDHHPGRLISMLDMILGAAERTKPPAPYSRGDVRAQARALAAEGHAQQLAASAGGSIERWFEAADAFEIAEDAWKEAGDDARAEQTAEVRERILKNLKPPPGRKRRS